MRNLSKQKDIKKDTNYDKCSLHDLKRVLVSDSLSVSCDNCGEDIDPRRKELGYNVCLACGELIAQEVKFVSHQYTSPTISLCHVSVTFVGINNKTSNQEGFDK